MVVKTPFSSKNIVAYSRLIERENLAMHYRNKKSHKSEFFFLQENCYNRNTTKEIILVFRKKNNINIKRDGVRISY